MPLIPYVLVASHLSFSPFTNSCGTFTADGFEDGKSCERSTHNRFSFLRASHQKGERKSIELYILIDT